MGYTLNHGILSLEEIYTAIINCEKIKDSAMILLMLSSNMDSRFLSSLTVGNLLDACGDELDDKNSIDELLGLNPWSIVPCWRDVANQKILSFNTPEATFHIFLYLKKRQKSGEELNHESPLFLGKGKSSMTTKSIQKKISKDGLDNFCVDFTQTSILNTFEFVCENYCDDKELVKLLKMEDVETNLLYNKTSSEVRECYKHLIPFLTAKSFNSEKGFGNDNALDTDKIITNYYEEYMKHRNVKYSFKEELEIKRNAKSHFELYENRELTPQQLKIIYKFTECEWIVLKDHLLKEESFSSFKISLEDCHDDESCIEFLYNFFKSKGIIDILEISEEKIKKEILIQSVNSRVNLTSLTKHGFLIIFYELLHVVLLDDTYSLLHLYF